MVAGFLAGYAGNTRPAYQHDLRVFVAWCGERQLGLLDAARSHIELLARGQESDGLAKAAVASEVVDGGELLPVLRR